MVHYGYESPSYVRKRKEATRLALQSMKKGEKLPKTYEGTVEWAKKHKEKGVGGGGGGGGGSKTPLSSPTNFLELERLRKEKEIKELEKQKQQEIESYREAYVSRLREISGIQARQEALNRLREKIREREMVFEEQRRRIKQFQAKVGFQTRKQLMKRTIMQKVKQKLKVEKQREKIRQALKQLKEQEQTYQRRVLFPVKQEISKQQAYIGERMRMSKIAGMFARGEGSKSAKEQKQLDILHRKFKQDVISPILKSYKSQEQNIMKAPSILSSPSLFTSKDNILFNSTRKNKNKFPLI